MSQEIPPDMEIPTLSQTLPSHFRTRPLDIPWITERAPKFDANKPVESPLVRSPSDDSKAQTERPASDDVNGSTKEGGSLGPSQQTDIARLVGQVIQATANQRPLGANSTQDAVEDALADQVVERVQARLTHLLPDLVQEVMEEMHQNPSPHGKPSSSEEIK